MDLAEIETSPRVFIAVATGQAVANLPPIVDLARPGDQVLWLESETAHRGQWSEPARGVLQERQIISLPGVKLPDTPADIVPVVQTVLQGLVGIQPVFVLNGGTKVMALAIELAQMGMCCPAAYSQDRPAEYWWMPQGIGGSLERRRFVRPLSLDEVLACSGYRTPSRSARKLWPDTRDIEPDGGGYGTDPDATGRAHQLAFEHETPYRVLRGIDPPTFGDLLTIDADGMNRWAGRAWDAAQGIMQKQASRPQERDLPAFIAGCRAEFTNIFHGARDRLRDAPTNAAKTFSRLQGRDRKLGTRFELAVARRIQAWLRTHGNAFGVAEAWHNVEVCPGKEGGTTVAELDILLLLANGVLLCLECKTYDIGLRDLDARLLSLRRAGSGLARMVLCAPVYTGFADADWAEAVRQKRSKINEETFPLIGLTLPGQPECCPVEQKPWPSFEDQLAKLLQDYRPTT